MRIGVDLGGTKIEGIILTNEGEISQKIRVATPGTSYKGTLTAVCQVITQLQDQLPCPVKVGIGAPGTLSKPSGLMKNCNSICLNGEALKKDIESTLGYEIRLENDANCFALSEAHYGAAKKSKSMFGVIIGTGTGGGIVINDQLLTGPNSIAGEWGHNSLPSSARELIAEDRLCYCGRRNCIETVLSGRGLKQSHLETTGLEIEANKIAELTMAQDPAASETLKVYSKQLARCLATIVNVIDPEMIVLGGGLSNIKSLYDSVPKDMADYVFTDDLQTLIAPPKFGDASGARGAACLWPVTDQK
ncbi:MAG: putative NBD/HSP70 family sugar kinase [Pseudohongiellaceae bacterium]|jgi:predicted NBD/HSP70 family sugar kinase